MAKKYSSPDNEPLGITVIQVFLIMAIIGLSIILIGDYMTKYMLYILLTLFCACMIL